MFAFGLVAGPFLGLVAGTIAQRLKPSDRRWSWLVIALIVVGIALASVLQTESRVGIIAGILLGLLLATTPTQVEGAAGADD